MKSACISQLMCTFNAAFQTHPAELFIKLRACLRKKVILELKELRILDYLTC